MARTCRGGVSQSCSAGSDGDGVDPQWCWSTYNIVLTVDGMEFQLEMGCGGVLIPDIHLIEFSRL